jgi:hypothetical protein
LLTVPEAREIRRSARISAGFLRFVFLLITRVATWLRLSRREEAWKTAEILILRHQLAVLQRRQPGRPRLDVLRQQGAVYQFRHATLQTYLASAELGPATTP